VRRNYAVSIAEMKARFGGVRVCESELRNIIPYAEEVSSEIVDISDVRGEVRYPDTVETVQ
jgi:hypothetical protein